MLCITCGVGRSKYRDENGLKLCKMCKSDRVQVLLPKSSFVCNTLMETCCRVIVLNGIDPRNKVPEGAGNVWKCLIKMQKKLDSYY